MHRLISRSLARPRLADHMQISRLSSAERIEEKCIFDDPLDRRAGKSFGSRVALQARSRCRRASAFIGTYRCSKKQLSVATPALQST